ncbi:MAG: YiiX/YebB-like N1pC/P60 family cysteine hydrolase, partial [Pseudomonadota bacterium]
MTTGCAKLDGDLAVFRSLATMAPASADALATQLRSASARVWEADLADYDIDGLKAHAHAALDDMFEARLALRERIGEWYMAGLMTPDVVRALRNVFRDGRYATDMLGELLFNYALYKDGDEPLSGFAGGPLLTLSNPKFGPDGWVDYQAGDVLLVRGTTANSAAIARSGDVDSQFSHVGLVHLDKAGKVTIVEALIESGGSLTPIDKALDGLSRAVLLRPRDKRIGAYAAALAHAYIERSRTGRLPRIPYDFSMRPEGYRQLFCSKLVKFAYSAATNGALILPSFGTQLAMQNRTFFEQIGVQTVDTFAPADIELEPGFDVVAEWRDFRKTPRIRLQDVAMDSMFAWMDGYGDRLKNDWLSMSVGVFGRIAARLPGPIK